MPHLRVVGWMDESEWESVYYNIFYGEKEEIRAALDVIAVWRVRLCGRIPVAIEATAQLFESYIMEGDENFLAKRQSMSAAISQFIGLLTERSLKGVLHAPPMYIRAEELGIPDWITTLRHDAAHGHIPSFEMLDKAMKSALEWLRVNHWEEILKKLRDKSIKNNEKVEFMENNLVDILRQILVPPLAKKSPGRKSASFQKLKGFLSQNQDAAEILPAVLIAHNFFPIQNTDGRKTKYFSGSGKKMHLTGWVQSNFVKILDMLKLYGMLDNFILKLCEEVSFPVTSPQLFSIWIDFIFDSAADYNVKDSVLCEVCSRLIKARASNHVIQKVLDSLKVLNGVKYDPNYNATILQQLESYSQSLQESSHETPTDNTNKVEDDGSWSLCEDLKNSPLGLLPGQSKDTLWQELYGHSLKPLDEIIQQWEDTYSEPVFEEIASEFSKERIDDFCQRIDLL